MTQKAQWDKEACITCGLCEQYCPDLAITVEKKTKEAANG